MMQKSLIDIHIHLPAFPDLETFGHDMQSDIFHPGPIQWLLKKFIRKKSGIDTENREAYLRGLADEISNSRHISRGVLLAVDGVYSENGELDGKRTCFMVTNHSVLAAVKQFKEFAFGCSINPLRPDAIDELLRCKGNGAVLLKIIPSVQGFNPSDRRFIPFYRRLGELGLPLLSHSGFEFALRAVDHAWSDPGLLKTALDQGVNVIVAHGGSTGVFIYERYLDTLRDLVKGYPNLFFDVSAMTLPSRALMLYKIGRFPDMTRRLLFGSDYPIPLFSFPFRFSMERGEYEKIKNEKNFFDRSLLIFNAMGIEFDLELEKMLFPAVL